MKKIAILVLILMVVGSVVVLYYLKPGILFDPRGEEKIVTPLPLEKYDFDNLRKYESNSGEIEILGPIKEVEDRRKAFLKANPLKPGEDVGMPYETREIRFKSEGKWVSGMMNYHPNRSSLSPVVIMVRGYAEKAGYYPGSGSWRAADEFAKKGYVTVSLDFLGYGNSDDESTDMLEARFHKVVEVLDLLASVEKLPWVDRSRIGFWAHSNGGQIVLSVLEITGGNHPAVLWAPMTNKFPDSVLTTIDPGSPVKAAMEEFLNQYDPRRYAFENYYQFVKAPVLIQQGTNDVWCEVDWQREVVSRLKSFEKSAELVVYDGADHNLAGNKGEMWKEAIKKDVEWYSQKL